MNFAFLLIFLLLQIVINSVLGIFIDTSNIYGVIAFNLASSLIISFLFALFATPAGYRKEFFKQPGFHKTMLTYFAIFFGLDLIFIFFL